MTRDEIINTILDRLGRRRGDQFLTQMAQSLIIQIQDELEGGPFLPWFLLSELAENQVHPLDQRVPLPDDFLLEYEQGALWYINDEGERKDLTKDDYDTLVETHEGSDPGPPEAYAFRGLYFSVFPVVDKVYNVKMLYYAQAPKLTSDIQNVWSKYAPGLLAARLGLRMAPTLPRNDLVQVFQREEQQAYARLQVRHEANMHTNRDYTMGD